MNIEYKNDVYFDPRLGKLYAKQTGGEFREFNFESPAGKVRHQFIIHPIELSEAVEDPSLESIFDLSTPYGYGGPLIIDVVPGRKQELLEGFTNEFEEYCNKQRVVSEFVRFHSIANNVLDFASIYNAQFFNHTVGINLADYDDPFQEEFSKSARKSVRRCLRDGLTYEIVEHSDLR